MLITKHKTNLLFLISIFFITNLFSQENTVAQKDKNDSIVKYKQTLIIDYSLIDLPFASYSSKIKDGSVSTDSKTNSYNVLQGAYYKSPEQAVQITNNIMQTVHWGISQVPIFKKRKKLDYFTKLLLTGTFDYVFSTLPYGSSWLHEEGHRSVMATSYTSSYNPFSIFNKKTDASGGGTHAVSHVLDTNLVMMKANNNANYVRLSTMGGEMVIYSVQKMQQNAFFNQNYNTKLGIQYPINSIHYLINIINIQGYIASCANKERTKEGTLDQIERDGSNQELRDFTGQDFAAWIYDLNRPNEPYSARGENPNGNGYDRYIYGDKLTDDEYKWLKKQSNLSFLNLLSPSNFLINSIKINNTSSFNFSGRYYPTSFGNQLGLDFFLKTSKFNFFVSPHINQNEKHNFFGLEAMMFEKKINLNKQQFLTTVRIVADIQPNSQEFKTAKTEFVGLANLVLAWKANKYFYPFVSIEGKNKGWIAGNVFLKETVSFKFGLSTRINY